MKKTLYLDAERTQRLELVFDDNNVPEAVALNGDTVSLDRLEETEKINVWHYVLEAGELTITLYKVGARLLINLDGSPLFGDKRHPVRKLRRASNMLVVLYGARAVISGSILLRFGLEYLTVYTISGPVLYGTIALIASQVRYGRLWALWVCIAYSSLELISILLFGVVLTGGNVGRIFVPAVVLILCVRNLSHARAFRQSYRPRQLPGQVLDDRELRP